MKKQPLLDENAQRDLLKKACDIAINAYAPYSKFRVGCAVLLNDDRVVLGVNIENASYPVTLCAERAALASVITSGCQHMIKAVAVVTSASPPGSPCGMCRQFLSEFLASDTPIILGNTQGEVVVKTMGELLPFAFDKGALCL
jgi:cytidine deaminase